MRWPFGPPHLTLKPSKKNTKQQRKQKKQKKQGKKNPKTAKIPPKKIQLSVKFLGWFFKRSLFFDTLAQKTLTQKTL